MVDHVECGTWHASGLEIIFKDDADRNAAIQTLESCQTLSQKHEKKWCVRGRAR